MDQAFYKAPRLYYPQPLGLGGGFTLEGAQHHYLKNVMRKGVGDIVRLFNPQDGEWAARIAEIGKKSLSGAVETQLRDGIEASGAEDGANVSPPQSPRITLAFSPLPKDRMDVLVEKAVELGVHALQPLTTEFSSVRKVNDERVTAQMVEAAEQCERMDIPVLHPLLPLTQWIGRWTGHHPDQPVFAALERVDAAPILEVAARYSQLDRLAFLIGPEGGFSQAEKDLLQAHSGVVAVNLGVTILRAETAAVAGIAVLSAAIRKA